MEAATLQRKKIQKGNIRKTIKNVLCRPDPVFWPSVSEAQAKILETAFSKYKVEIPDFKKPLWKDLKSMPKKDRPKPPKIKRVEGLLFGLSECSNAIQNKCCAALIIEATVNPRAIVQPVIETCIQSRIPVICLSGLRTMSASNFGIPTSCLGIKCDCLIDLRTQVLEIAKCYKLPQITTPQTESMEISDSNVNKSSNSIIKPDSSIPCPYLYRTSTKKRVFNPSEDVPEKQSTDFSGQDFIEFAGGKKPANENVDRKSYMKMLLKRISNNPNRVKVAK